MKQHQITKAYKDSEQLADIKDFHAKEHKLIFDLRKKLYPHVEFQAEREEAIRAKYLPFVNKEGVLEGDKYQEYLTDVFDLNNMEVDETIEKIKLPLVDGITFKLMEDLEDFIEFVKE